MRGILPWLWLLLCPLVVAPAGSYVEADSSEILATAHSASNLLTFIEFNENSLSEPIQWNKTYGGTQYDVAYSVQQTNDGGYIAAGTTVSYSVNSDSWLIKTDASGNMEWNRTYGGTDDYWSYSVQQTSDGGYISAGAVGFLPDLWFFKTDASGNMEWNRTFGGSGDDRARSIQQTSDGGYIVSGHTGSSGAGNDDYWLIKANASGNVEWNKTYGGTAMDRAYSAQQTSDGGYVVVGSADSYKTGIFAGEIWLIKTDKYGNISWSWLSGWPDWDFAYDVQQTDDGGYIIAGTRFSSYDSRYDFWLIKLHNNGTLDWHGVYECAVAGTGSVEDVAYSVQQTIDGGYIVAGGWFDFKLVKTDALGNVEWKKAYGGKFSDNAYSVQQSNDGGYIVAGRTDNFGFGQNGRSDAWLIKLFPVHDVAIGEIDPDGNDVAQNLSLQVNVVVENPGFFSEDVNVTLYANGSVVGSDTVDNLGVEASANLTFLWDTTGFALGNYTLSAYVWPVVNETDTLNNLFVGGVVSVRLSIHDVAVIDVLVLRNFVGENYLASVNVTVENEGDLLETLNVTAFANGTLTANVTIILDRGGSDSVTIIWSTTGLAKGNYSMTGYVSPVPGEVDLADNVLVEGWLFVSIPGDVDGDRDVDIFDVVAIAESYNTQEGDPTYVLNYDINYDGKIDIFDIVIAAQNYGESWS